MLENWCWTPSQLKAMSHHYSHMSAAYASTWRSEHAADGDDDLPRLTMPDELIDRVVKARNVDTALQTLMQVHYSKFDMFVHGPDLPSDVDASSLARIYNEMGKECTRLVGPEAFGAAMDWGHGYATFAHLICGMQSNYYSYQL